MNGRNAEFDRRIAELTARIQEVPPHRRAALLPLLDETLARQAAIEENREAAIEALADWRIAMKYLVFDLEATARTRGN